MTDRIVMFVDHTLDQFGRDEMIELRGADVAIDCDGVVIKDSGLLTPRPATQQEIDTAIIVGGKS